MSRQELGQRGEECAAAFLERKGYRIAARNYRAKVGEIDIIAWQDRETLVFVEVKTRASDAFGGGRAAVDRRKRHAQCRAAARYLRRRPQTPFRFDVVEVVGAPDGAAPVVRHIEHAFSLGPGYRLPW